MFMDVPTSYLLPCIFCPAWPCTIGQLNRYATLVRSPNLKFFLGDLVWSFSLAHNLSPVGSESFFKEIVAVYLFDFIRCYWGHAHIVIDHELRHAFTVNQDDLGIKVL